MSLFVTSLNSGSNGNCFYIGNEQDAVLIDAGISCRETEKRLLRLNLSMKKIRAIFISHEHTDHVRGIKTLAKRYQLPIYSIPGTLKENHLDPDYPHSYSLYPYREVSIGDLKITAFPKSHDAHDPQSFVVSCQKVRVGIFTDIGNPCDHVVNHFKTCNAVFLETNYDPEMLMNGRYPYYLKRRISSSLGHLSNEQALELFCRYRGPHLSHLFLSHLSAENNDPALVQKLFDHHANGVEIVLTSRVSEIPVYSIGGPPTTKRIPAPIQLSIFSQRNA